MSDDIVIPEGLNLRNTDFGISQEAQDLARQSLSELKSRIFFCSTIKSDSDYTSCLTCDSNDGCSFFIGIDKKVEVCEFFLDLEPAKEPLKKKKSK